MGNVIDLWKAQEQSEMLCECNNNSFSITKIGNSEIMHIFCSKCKVRIINMNVLEKEINENI